MTVNLTAVSKAAAQASQAAIDRDAAIRLAHEQGASVRLIAACAGLSFQRVHQIVRNKP